MGAFFSFPKEKTYAIMIYKGSDGVKSYKAAKSRGMNYILILTLIYNALILFLLFYINSYVLSSLLKAIIIIFNLYQLYYILLNVSLNYILNDNEIIISAIFGLKKIHIPLDSIMAYNRYSGNIKGIQLYGYGKNKFAFGKSFIDKIGFTDMFVPSSDSIIYLKTDDMVYGIAPDECNEFESNLKSRNIENKPWVYKANKNINFHKDKKFMIPFLSVSIIILYITLNPFILYLFNKLPAEMPLKFDAAFNAIKFGTGKQFAFKQMVFGLLNMAFLFCMYYASYFYARYDKKSAYKFIYISVIVAVLFLIMQIRIIYVY